MSAVKIAGIVLAAGLSTRFGASKQLAELEGETLAGRAVRIAKDAGCSPVIAVILDAELIDSLQKLGATVLLNRRTYEGLSSSIMAGVEAARAAGADGVVLMTCDQPALTVAHLHALAAEPNVITGSAYAGRVGVPAYFPSSVFEQLMKLTGDSGARGLLRDARSVPNEQLALDIDTPSDLERARKLLRG